MELSDSLHPCRPAVPPMGSPCGPGSARSGAGPPGSRTPCCRACQGSPTPPGPSTPRQNGASGVAFRVFGAGRHPEKAPISGLHTLPARSPVNASLPPLPRAVHDAGPAWVAHPSLSAACTLSHRAGLSRHTPTPRLQRRGPHHRQPLTGAPSCKAPLSPVCCKPWFGAFMKVLTQHRHCKRWIRSMDHSMAVGTYNREIRQPRRLCSGSERKRA
jgi:hypothetical protein